MLCILRKARSVHLSVSFFFFCFFGRQRFLHSTGCRHLATKSWCVETKSAKIDRHFRIQHLASHFQSISLRIVCFRSLPVRARTVQVWLFGSVCLPVCPHYYAQTARIFSYIFFSFFIGRGQERPQMLFALDWHIKFDFDRIARKDEQCCRTMLGTQLLTKSSLPEKGTRFKMPNQSSFWKSHRFKIRHVITRSHLSSARIILPGWSQIFFLFFYVFELDDRIVVDRKGANSISQKKKNERLYGHNRIVNARSVELCTNRSNCRQSFGRCRITAHQTWISFDKTRFANHNQRSHSHWWTNKQTTKTTA